MASKWKPLAFFMIIILFLTALEICNFPYLKQLSEEVQNAEINPKSAVNLSWFEFVARELGDESINVALVNTDESDNVIPTKGKILKVEFEHVDEAVQWSHLYPSWINEATAKCPKLPMPVLDRYEQVDVVVARVPLNASGLKDVFKLQVNLVVANLVVRCGRAKNGVSRPVFAVFIGPNGSMWEMFRCDDHVMQIGDSWIYKPHLGRMRQILLMPVGSCQLNPSLPQLGEELKQRRREAYATVLHSTEAYVCGAIALAQSILQRNTSKDLILLADDHISPESTAGLRAAGWKIKRIQRIRNPHSKKNSYNEWNYSKLRLWQLTDYDKIMFIDADLIVTTNLDRFFSQPQISAAGNARHIFNSGVMLLEPSACTFQTLMKRRWAVRSYNGGDQGFLNEMFPWWHRLPKKVNRLKDFQDREEHGFRGDAVHAIHYLGLKPWWCYRDYDCNWDREIRRRFASDAVHRRWWRVHDAMPAELRRFCALTPEMDARIRKYRDLAKRAKFGDGHWRIKIKDPRQILL